MTGNPQNLLDPAMAGDEVHAELVGLVVGARTFTVSCDEHGPMERDHLRCRWRCTAQACRAWLPDEDVHRLVTGAPTDSPDPLPIVVT